MTRALMILMLLLAGCSGGSSGDAMAPSPQAEQPASPPPVTPPPPVVTPTVNAGPDQTVKLGTVVALSGSSTTTEPRPNYLWQFLSLPQGSSATLTGCDHATPTFTPDVTGLYIVSLSLEGGPSDSVTIEVQANLLTLHFTGTFGPDGTVNGTFTYEITQGPSATNVRSLQPNVMYRLTSWNFVVNSGQVAVCSPPRSLTVPSPTIRRSSVKAFVFSPARPSRRCVFTIPVPTCCN